MTQLSNILAYVCNRYPHKGDLSKARLNKIVYLADWLSALETGQQVSNIRWQYNHYGPYVDDIINEVRGNARLHLKSTHNFYGDLKEIISSDADYQGELPETASVHLDKAMQESASRNFNEFIDLVYSTYPVKSQQKGQALDLIKLAEHFKQMKRNAAA